MQALRLNAWKTDGKLQEVPEPEPGPGQILVRIGGAGACHSDLHLMQDFEPATLPFEPPFTLGHENAGWVEPSVQVSKDWRSASPSPSTAPGAVGGADDAWPAWRTTATAKPTSASWAVASAATEGWRALMLVPSPRFLVPLGDLDPLHAAPLTDAGLTPYHAVKRSLPLLVPGSTAVVIGVGGLGHVAVQLLRVMSPATVVAVDQRAEALDLATKVGADHTISTRDEAAAVIRELVGSRAADVVLDFVGSDSTLPLAAELTRPLGHLTIVGIAGGTLPVSFFGVGYEVSVATTYWGGLPELVEVLALASAGKLHTRIEQFPMSGAVEAYEALRAGTLQGWAVIVP